jgi:hypothetical protein
LAGVEPGKLSDDQIKAAVSADPAVAQTLRIIAGLTQDGRTVTGDGHGTRVEERLPAYPYNPEYYRAKPDTDPEKRWFIARGARYEDGKYIGGFATTGR